MPNSDSLQRLLHKLPNNRLSSDAHREAGCYVFWLARVAIAAGDSLLRIFLEIHEFTLDPRCILMFSRCHSGSPVKLTYGESVRDLKPALRSDVLRDCRGR